MGNIDKSALTTEQLMMAIKCKTADELIALAKSGGFDMTKEEAEAYIAEMSDVELDEEALAKVAGGSSCYSDCIKDNWVPL
ncbi:MAG: Nif11-like leader peptide family RiPP precursor [Lachnospiraceae bacterium]|nr:Nif11-like leader peptide family RiPP precursor [Lachnospiraceae bacterium]